MTPDRRTIVQDTTKAYLLRFWQNSDGSVWHDSLPVIAWQIDVADDEDADDLATVIPITCDPGRGEIECVAYPPDLYVFYRDGATTHTPEEATQYASEQIRARNASNKKTTPLTHHAQVTGA